MVAEAAIADRGTIHRAERKGAALTAPLIIGATLGNLFCVTPTVTAVFGLFLVPISEEFGWSRVQVAGAFTALSLANAVMFPIAGRLADRFGPRPLMVTGYFLLGLSILGLARLPPNPWLFYGLFALTGMIGAFPSNMLICKLLSEWFDTGRGFWMGLTGGVGNGVGATVMPMLAVSLMAAHGWRGAFTGIGLMVLLLGLPLAWLTLRPPPTRQAGPIIDEKALSGVSLGQALRSPRFWVIFSAVPVGGGCLTAVFANVAPILTDHKLSGGSVTLVIAAFALTCTLWEPLVGFLLDRSIRPRVVAPFYLCAAFGLVILVNARSLPALIAGGIMTGIGLGSEFSVLPYVLSRYFGLRSMGAITGIAFAGVLTSTALAPIALNLAFDRLGSYALAVYAVSALLVYAAVVFVLLKPYPAWPDSDQ